MVLYTWITAKGFKQDILDEYYKHQRQYLSNDYTSLLNDFHKVGTNEIEYNSIHDVREVIPRNTTSDDTSKFWSYNREGIAKINHEINAIKRQLDGKNVANEITDTKPNEKNLVKLIFLVVCIIVIIVVWFFINRKMRNYLDKDSSDYEACLRKGRMHLYFGNEPKKTAEQLKDSQSHIAFNNDTKYVFA